MLKALITLFIIIILLNLFRTEDNLNQTNEIVQLESEYLNHLENNMTNINQTNENHKADKLVDDSDHSNKESNNITNDISELKKEEEVIHNMEENEAFTDKLILEMGFNKGNITKSQFKVFIYRLITKDEQIDENEKEFYNEVINKIATNMTEQFDHTELQQHINHNRFVEALDMVIAEKYGENVLKEVQADPEEEKGDL